METINLPSGKVVFDRKFDSVDKIEDAKFLIVRSIDNYRYLSSGMRSKKSLLNFALSEFARQRKYEIDGLYTNYFSPNPISFATMSAMDEKNMKRAINLGNLMFTGDNVISGNTKFILAVLDSKWSETEKAIALRNISTGAKLNYNIAISRLPLYERYSKKIHTMSTYDMDVEHRSSLTFVLPNGMMYRNETSSTYGEDDFSKQNAYECGVVLSTIENISNLSDNDDNTVKELLDLYEECSNLDDERILKEKCSNKGILVLSTVGHETRIYAPLMLSNKQFDILVSLLTEDIPSNLMSIVWNGGLYDFERRGYGHNTTWGKCRLFDILGYLTQNKLDTNYAPDKNEIIHLPEKQMVPELKGE